MKTGFKPSMIMFLLMFSVVSEARLIIIQDDSVLKAKQELAAKEDRLAAKEAKQLADDKAAAEQIERLKKKEEAIRTATVSFDQGDFNVVADRTEKIIRHFGIPPRQLPAQGGAGLDSPFWVSMNAIIPDGWKVFTDKGIDSHKAINWNGYRSNWIGILFHIGVEHHTTFDIDWNQQLVLVRPRKSAIDYLKDELEEKNNSRVLSITVEAEEDSLIPEGGEGVLVINGKAVKVRKAQRKVPAEQ